MARQPERRPQPEVHSITAARRPHGDEMHERMVRYAVSMGIRTACFLLAFLVTGWLQWVFFAGAILLPYVAVLIANAGREQTPEDPSSLLGHAPSGTPSGPPAEPAPLRVLPALAAAPSDRRAADDVLVQEPLRVRHEDLPHAG